MQSSNPVRSAKPVTVSIVSHGQLDMIQPLLEQLSRFSSDLLDKVVLTHNLPEPDLLAGRRFGFELQRIHNPAPLGFGANNNQAFQHCASDWFLVLNPDIRLDAEVLGPLIGLAPPLRRAIGRAGTVVLSGLLDHQAREVAATWRANGFRLARRLQRAGWTALVVAKP